jgi:hypothetical protein
MRLHLSEFVEKWRKDAVATERSVTTPMLVFEATGDEHSGEAWALTGSASVGKLETGHDPVLFVVEKRAGVQNPFTMGVTLGRVETNDVSIDDSSVSRFHAWLQYDERSNQWSLCDADSKNGTFVDGEALGARQRKVVYDGGIIRLGNAHLRFLLPESVITRLRMSGR